MRTVPFSLGDVTYHLLLNASAMYDLYDIFGEQGYLTDHLNAGGRQGFENTCVFLEKLAEQGELWRRYLGYDHGPLPQADLFRVSLSPLSVIVAKAALVDAIRAGFARDEADQGGPVDKGLLALQKKTAAGSSGGNT